MAIRFFGPSGGSIRAFDEDVVLWRDAVVANGGSVSLDRLIIVDQFVFSEKNAGTWALTDDYWGFWAENAIQALTSLKQRRLATAVNSPTFTADRGYTTDGLTNYLNTGFVPSTSAVSMSTNSVHVESYQRTNVASGGNSIGGGSGSNRSIRILNRDVAGTSALVDANSASGTFTLPATTSLGLTQGGRSGTLTTDTYGAKNGVAMTRTITPSGVGASLPSHGLYIGGYNNAGTYIGGLASSFGYASTGAALTGAQLLARYTNVQAWATSVGANV